MASTRRDAILRRRVDVQHATPATHARHENVMSQNKYVMLAANSSLKGKSDFNKFHKAMQLKGCIDKVRRDYQRHLDSSDRQLKQQATTMWLIDVLALRVGGEKNEDEADTVGCCSLRVEHFTFHSGGKDVDLEFLGKDSIRFKQSIDFQNVDSNGPRVHANLTQFCKGKSKNEQVFDLITPTELNKHLSSIMPGLTAKVFRTYNASETLQNQLPKAEDVKKLPTPQDKIVAYNEANRTVAILCNHQRTVSAAAATGLEEKADRLEQLKNQRRELQSWKGLSSKKIPLHSGEDPSKKAAELVDKAKQMKNDAKTADEKVAATKAYESAMDKRRQANKAKQAEAHKFKNPPDEDAIDKRIEMWTEKVKKMEVELRNKEENKEVSLGTSKANYMDPRITVAWCKRCDLEINWAMGATLFPNKLKRTRTRTQLGHGRRRRLALRGGGGDAAGSRRSQEDGGRVEKQGSKKPTRPRRQLIWTLDHGRLVQAVISAASPLVIATEGQVRPHAARRRIRPRMQHGADGGVLETDITATSGGRSLSVAPACACCKHISGKAAEAINRGLEPDREEATLPQRPVCSRIFCRRDTHRARAQSGTTATGVRSAREA